MSIVRKLTSGTVILSSIGFDSKCSTMLARRPASAPIHPSAMYPIGITTAAIAMFPAQDFVLRSYSMFLTTPVTPSPNAMNATGITPYHQLWNMIHARVMITPHIIMKCIS